MEGANEAIAWKYNTLRFTLWRRAFAQNVRPRIPYLVSYATSLSKAATVQIFFGSVLIFGVGFRLFRFGSSNCILFVFYIQNMYS